MKVVGTWLLLALFPLGLRLWSQEAAGNRAYRRGDYARAAERYREALAEEGGNPRLDYNLGTALLRQAELEAARGRLTAALGARTPDLRSQAFYNLGNAHAEDAGDGGAEPLRAAIAAYRRSLLLDPDQEDARWNLELALRRLEEETQAALSGPEQSPTPPRELEEGEGSEPAQGAGPPPLPQPGEVPPPEGAARETPDSPFPRELAEQVLRAVEERERGLQREKLRRQRRGTTGPDW